MKTRMTIDGHNIELGDRVYLKIKEPWYKKIMYLFRIRKRKNGIYVVTNFSSTSIKHENN
jgi:hypothetical protein